MKVKMIAACIGRIVTGSELKVIEDIVDECNKIKSDFGHADHRNMVRDIIDRMFFYP